MSESDNILHKQAWDYYELHAAQRMTTVNFYISISSVLAGVLFALLQNAQLSRISAFLGLLLAFFSYVFWKWDRRSRDMVNIAEEALRFFEEQTNPKSEGAEPPVTKVFQREAYLTNQRRKHRSIFFWKNYYTYRVCLNLIFISFALVGLAGATLALFL